MKNQPAGKLTASGPDNMVKLNIFEKAFLDAYNETSTIREVLRKKSAEYAAAQAKAANDAASSHGAADSGNANG